MFHSHIQLTWDLTLMIKTELHVHHLDLSCTTKKYKFKTQFNKSSFNIIIFYLRTNGIILRNKKLELNNES